MRERKEAQFAGGDRDSINPMKRLALRLTAKPKTNSIDQKLNTTSIDLYQTSHRLQKLQEIAQRSRLYVCVFVAIPMLLD